MYDSWRQQPLWGSIKTGRQGDDGACAAQPDEIPSIGAEVAAAGIQPFNRAAVTNDPPIRVERQHPVGTAVEKEQPFVPIDGKAAWIGNAAVTAEGTERPAIEVEGQKRAISVAICTGRACDKERHLNYLS